MKIVGASILSSKNKIKTIEELILNNINWIHFDVMDGIFVPNKSLELGELNLLLEKIDTFYYKDVHLMVADPLKYIDQIWNKVDFITVHYEAIKDKKVCDKIIEWSKKINIGIAIKPETKIETVSFLLPFCSHILIMSVNPGKGGQKFIDNTLNKIKNVVKIKKEKSLDFFIGVDGGINDLNSQKCFESGSNLNISGSFLLNDIDNFVKMKFRKLKTKVNS